MWSKFSGLDVRIQAVIVAAIVILFVLAAIYGSPSPSVDSQ